MILLLFKTLSVAVGAPTNVCHMLATTVIQQQVISQQHLYFIALGQTLRRFFKYLLPVTEDESRVQTSARENP